MTGAVQELLDTLDSLSEAEKHDAAAQVLRRVVEGESRMKGGRESFSRWRPSWLPVNDPRPLFVPPW